MGYLVDLGLPALVFLGLCVWLVRKVVRAARTESDLESDRLRGALAEELRAAKLRAAGLQQRLSVVPGQNENQNENENQNDNRNPTATPTPTPTPNSTSNTPTPNSTSNTPTSNTPTPTPPSTSDSTSPQPKNPSPALAPLPDPSPSPLSGADLRDANPEHLPLISALVTDRETQLRSQHPSATSRHIDVLWVRSISSHCAWLERRHAASPAARPRDVICVARIDRGKIAERWSFG